MCCIEGFIESFGTTQVLLIYFSVLVTSSYLGKCPTETNHELLVATIREPPITQLFPGDFIILD